MNTIVSTSWLFERLDNDNLIITDTRWVSDDFDGGAKLYKENHIPGAIFVDVDVVLSDRSDLTKGRHPLPDPNKLANKLAEFGINEKSFIVAYDDAGGSVAARLWWMMRWLGLNNAVVLDGGITRWIAEGRPLEQGSGLRERKKVSPIQPKIRRELFLEMAKLETNQDNILLVDARAEERYRGEIEPIDTRAGHIPGAVNVPFDRNLTESDAPVFRSSQELKQLYEEAGVNGQTDTVCYCGSGVTACHDLLALSIAGIDNAKLYPGSWSEWICHHEDGRIV